MKLAVRVLTYVAASALALGAIVADEPPRIHECKDADGNVVYQDEPCIDDVPVAPKPQAAGKPRAGAKSKVVTKPRPATKPEVAAQPRVAPKSWVVVKSRSMPMEPLPVAPSELPLRPVDARWASPETTLRTFVGAVKTGDRALVLSCLTSGALADLGPDAEALPLEKLRETVASFTGYVAEGDLGPYWSIRALRAGTRPKWIFFERTWDGAWKIGAI